MTSFMGTAPTPVIPSPETRSVASFTKFRVPVTAASFFRRPSSSVISFGLLPVKYDAVIHRRSGRLASFRCYSALTPELKTYLDKLVASHKMVLFMKGTKDSPQDGDSSKVVQALESVNATFETINILENEFVGQALKEYSSWSTFPQLYIDGEFFGGLDIVVEACMNGELQTRLHG